MGARLDPIHRDRHVHIRVRQTGGFGFFGPGTYRATVELRGINARTLLELRDKDSNLDSRIQSPPEARSAKHLTEPKRCNRAGLRLYNWVGQSWANGGEWGQSCSLSAHFGA